MKKGTAVAARAVLPLENAIEHTGGLPVDVVRGLDLLARSRPLWPIDDVAWRVAIGSVLAFAERWDFQARAEGWTDLELYGLHRFAPWANLSAMGAAFVLARSGFTAIAVVEDGILLRAGTGSTLQIRRFALNPDAVIAWSLCAGGNVR